MGVLETGFLPTLDYLHKLPFLLGKTGKLSGEGKQSRVLLAPRLGVASLAQECTVWFEPLRRKTQSEMLIHPTHFALSVVF